jgi:predicted nucleic acid-binding Zn ribbon protein
MEMTRIWDKWTESVGNEITKNAKPAAFKDGTLIVNVSSSVWIQHLKFLKNDMISNLNNILNKKLVKEIKFKIAKLHN